MAKEAAKTGSEPTVLLALEQSFPLEKRVLVDDLAYRVQPAGVRFFISISKPFIGALVNASEKGAAPGLWGALLCRKRYIDEKLSGSLPQVEQIVNLGAGSDTRLFRLSEAKNLPAWELDQPENIQKKQEVFSRVLQSIPSNIKLVSIDFDHEDILDVLIKNGFDPHKKTFFILEAVTQYLTVEGVNATFLFLSKAQPGSRVAFTYVHQDFLDGKNLFGWQSGYKRFVKNNIFIYGLRSENVGDFLAGYGYKLIEDPDYSQLTDRYIKPSGRDLTVSKLEHVVLAEKL